MARRRQGLSFASHRDRDYKTIMKTVPTKPDTREQLLAAATELVETLGYNAFSYRDLAERVGIRTASIHYHFPTKSDLGRELVAQHRRDNADFLQRVDRAGGSSLERLRRYCEAFRKSYGNGPGICLGGMMATDSESLPPVVLAEVRSCYQDHETWLRSVLAAGREQGELQFHGSPTTVARVIFDALEGAMMATRAFRTPRRLIEMIDWQLSQISPS